MLSSQLEYFLALLVLAAAGLALTWKGLLKAAQRPHFTATVSVFFGYCLVIYIIGLRLGWWHFDAIEGLVLFAIFTSIVLATWETLSNERN